LPIKTSRTKFGLYSYDLYLLAVVVAMSYRLRISRIRLGLLAI